VIPAGLFNSSTFVVSALLRASIAFPLRGSLHGPEATPVPTEPFWPSVRAGFAYLRSNVALLQLTISATFMNFFLSIVLSFLVAYVVGELGVGSVVYGLVLGSFSIGFAVGAVLVGRTAAVRHMGKVWVITGAATAVPIAALVLFPGPVVAFGSVLAIGILMGYGGVTWRSGAQLIVPGEMQGRYFGVDQLGSIAILPLAQISGFFSSPSTGSSRRTRSWRRVPPPPASGSACSVRCGGSDTRRGRPEPARTLGPGHRAEAGERFLPP
jgi:hypothetical protein